MSSMSLLSSDAALSLLSSDAAAEFYVWMRGRGFSKVYARMCRRYVEKFGGLLDSGRLSFLGSLPRNARRHALAALSNYAKWRGEYGRFQRLLHECGLRWNEGNGAEGLFEILWNGKETVDAAYSWLQQLREKADENVYFQACYTALLGCRPVEACNSLALISRRGLEGYLNRETLVLEHFRYPEIFIRKHKRLYISVVTESLAQRLESWKGREVLPIEKLEKIIERRYEMACKLHLLRKMWSTIMRNIGLHDADINLLQGRCDASVLTMFYYRPSLHEIFRKVKQKVAELEAQFLS